MLEHVGYTYAQNTLYLMLFNCRNGYKKKRVWILRYMYFACLVIQYILPRNAGMMFVRILVAFVINFRKNGRFSTWLPPKSLITCYVKIISNFFQLVKTNVGRDSSVGIATGYGLDGPGTESRWKWDFPHLFRPALGPTHTPVQWVLCFSRG